MARQPRGNLSRREAQKDPAARVLIVCEGKKTEPTYFSDLKREYRLTAASVKIAGEGADPQTVVAKANERQEAEKRAGDSYDRVYCVFDRDEHQSFDAACGDAARHGFQLARSWPCFEYWLLLHFKSGRSPYARNGTGSAADNCINDLKKYFPSYTKSAEGIFTALQSKLDVAVANARATLRDAKATNDHNPSTEIHRLVEYLKSLSQEPTKKP